MSIGLAITARSPTSTIGRLSRPGLATMAEMISSSDVFSVSDSSLNCDSFLRSRPKAGMQSFFKSVLSLAAVSGSLK
ncbi:MAG: hypothetical protein WBD27_18855 [Pyrinomonadaceae bacterium]